MLPGGHVRVVIVGGLVLRIQIPVLPCVLPRLLSVQAAVLLIVCLRCGWDRERRNGGETDQHLGKCSHVSCVLHRGIDHCRWGRGGPLSDSPYAVPDEPCDQVGYTYRLPPASGQPYLARTVGSSSTG